MVVMNTFVYLLACELVYSSVSLLPSIEQDEFSIFKLMFFFGPILISSLQLVLMATVFKYDTPLQLCKDLCDIEACSELEKIYKNPEDRINEYRALMEEIDKTKSHMPNYTDLFSDQYLKVTIYGTILMVFRNFAGLSVTRAFAGALFEKNDIPGDMAVIFTAGNIGGTFIALLFVDGTLYYN